MTKDPHSPLQIALIEAIDRLDAGAVRQALNDGANPNLAHPSLWAGKEVPAMGRAQAEFAHSQWPGNQDIYQSLIEAGAKVNDFYGRMAFRDAVNAYNLPLVRFFFERGFDMHGQVWPLWTQDLSLMRYLVEEQALPVNVSIPDRGTPLHHVCLFRNEGQVRYLLSKGANIDALDDHRNTPLNLCVQNGADELVPLLLENHANPRLCNYQGNTPLHFVSDACTAKMLMDYGADLHAVNQDGFTPLDIGDPEALATIEHRLLHQRTFISSQAPTSRRL